MAPLQQGRNAFEIFKRQFVQLTKTDSLNNNLSVSFIKRIFAFCIEPEFIKGTAA